MAIHERIRKAGTNTWRMTEDTVRQFVHIYKNAVKVEGSLEVRELVGSTSDWQHSPPKS
jgi:hypothetical protein